MSSLRKKYDKIASQPRTPLTISMSQNGDNATFNAIGDYSGTPVRFYSTALPNRDFLINRITIEVSDNGTLSRSNYGAISGGLTNGIQFYIIQNGVETIISNPPLIKSNSDYLDSSNVFQIIDFGASDDSIFYGLDFSQFADPVVINGDNGDQFGVILNDNFTTLVAHKFSLLASTLGPKNIDLP